MFSKKNNSPSFKKNNHSSRWFDANNFYPQVLQNDEWIKFGNRTFNKNQIKNFLGEAFKSDCQSKPSGMNKLTGFLCYPHATQSWKIILDNKFKYNLNLIVPLLPH